MSKQELKKTIEYDSLRAKAAALVNKVEIERAAFNKPNLLWPFSEWKREFKALKEELEP